LAPRAIVKVPAIGQVSMAAVMLSVREWLP
jgi:hypothetical protein